MTTAANAIAAHARASFAAQAAEDAAAAAAAAPADGDADGAAAYAASSAAWAASGDALKATAETAAVLVRALASLVDGGRLTLARAVEVASNPAAYVAGGEVLIEEEGVSYSLWGNPVYW